MLVELSEFAQKYHMFPDEGLILAAVSGGADSMCLLAALMELSEKRGFSVAAAHYNHRLRGEESVRDARFVENYCHERQIPIYSSSGDVSTYARLNNLGIEEAARQLRYGFFYETAKIINAKRIATAHTADDNAETVLMNLTRGSGLNGLAGIPPMRDIIIRPMLSVTRCEVISFISQRDIPFVEDSTNKLDIYSRNTIRHHVIPVLRELNPQFTKHISAASELLREDEAYLNSIAESYLLEHSDRLCDASQPRNTDAAQACFDARELAALPYPIASRVIRSFYGNNLSLKHVAAILELSASGSTCGEVALPFGFVYREYSNIIFSCSTHMKNFTPVELIPGEKIQIPELGLTVKCHMKESSEKFNKTFTTFLFKYDNICGKIVIRPRQTGDKMTLFGRSVSKTLKKLFIERQIPLRKRLLIPVIADDKGVLAVYGIGFDERVACKPGDPVLEIIFEETTHEK
jgi:tRNA(Ile)-lysidine synthase